MQHGWEVSDLEKSSPVFRDDHGGMGIGREPSSQKLRDWHSRLQSLLLVEAGKKDTAHRILVSCLEKSQHLAGATTTQNFRINGYSCHVAKGSAWRVSETQGCLWSSFPELLPTHKLSVLACK